VRTRQRRRVFVSGVVIAISVAGCGKSSTNPSPTPTPGPTITISSSGVSPKTLTVRPGSQVTFTNNDVRDHEMDSDPHPDHTDCPAINAVDFLTPGQSKQTGNLNIVRTCGFHDHMRFEDASLRGSITIQ
jgi:plastocyanin